MLVINIPLIIRYSLLRRCITCAYLANPSSVGFPSQTSQLPANWTITVSSSMKMIWKHIRVARVELVWNCSQIMTTFCIASLKWFLLFTLFHHRVSLNSVSAVCELSVADGSNLYRYNLAAPTPMFPHGALSEDG